MADVKICDRCGKKIVKPSGILLNSKLHYCSLLHEDFTARLSYDLCLDCYKDFKHFVYGGKEE